MYIYACMAMLYRIYKLKPEGERLYIQYNTADANVVNSLM